MNIIDRKTSGRRNRRATLPLLLLCAVLVPALGVAQEHDDLLDLSIEELMNVEVTTASKSSQKLSHIPAAVFVLTQDDIRRSGATTIADALRFVPGIEVGQLDANKWAISARGFNRRFANKLLVLMDGRTLYTPLFSGVFWEIQNTVLEDIERIEIIRGPGATVWGANAVDGIVNIITKNAANTNGTLLSATSGTAERAVISARSGLALANDWHGRGFVHTRSHDSQFSDAADGAHDDWDLTRAGFRLDQGLSAQAGITIQGEAYQGKMSEKVNVPLVTAPYSDAVIQHNDVSGYFLMGSWRREVSAVSRFALQTYFDHNERLNPSIVGDDNRDIFDIDFHHTYVLGERNEVHWGAGYRFISDKISGTSTLTAVPAEQTAQLANAFLQDMITLLPNGTTLTLGAKLETSSVSEEAFLPSARLNVPITPSISAWSAVSRAARSTSRVERSIQLNTLTIPPSTVLNPSPWPVVARLTGSSDVADEHMTAYEAGVRLLPTAQMSINVAAFQHNFTQFRTFETGSRFCAASGTPPPCGAGDYIVQLRTMDDNAEAKAYGFETDLDWRATAFWRLRATYSYLDVHVSLDGGSTDTTTKAFEGRSPTHHGTLTSNFDVSRTVEFDLMVRYVGELESDRIPSYTAYDARLAWRPTDELELALIGHNLTDAHHPEFLPDVISTQATEVERSVSARMVWHF